MNSDITNLDDIKLLVDSFYDEIKKDKLLSPIFNGIIQDNWNIHLEKMYRFWETVLLDHHTYRGSPFMPHANLPVEKQHFETWLTIFRNTVDSFFKGDKAEEAKWRAEKMAQMFYYKISFHRKNSSTPLF
ncbi:group III truncated hemoglobin [Zhouia amylolytica]|uniref:Globin family protein n=1 Tax=Zhouia amylolytica AD3 TaxID=1286632 RepID=W2UPP6_9FLAO|nr:group III truncated hemoglobin [Zhouia amylolytica]ETN96160.1 globin family protein [Zhouia amylolytica AD3]